MIICWLGNSHLHSQLYLHEDDRTSYLQHTIGKLFLHTFCSCEHVLSSTSVEKSYDKCPPYHRARLRGYPLGLDQMVPKLDFS